MTHTTKPNGDRDRPSEGTASSGSTSPPLDMALLRGLADEFGYWPATTDEADIERHRRLNAALDRNYRPHRWHHLEAAHKRQDPRGGLMTIKSSSQPDLPDWPAVLEYLRPKA